MQRQSLIARKENVEALWRSVRREKILAPPNYRTEAFFRFQLIDLTHEHKRLSSQIAVLTDA
jgi:hypothetical protein